MGRSSIYLTDEIRRKLRCPPRGQSAAVSATIGRYYSLLTPEREFIFTLFDHRELNIIRAACQGETWRPENIRGGILERIRHTVHEETKDMKIADWYKLETRLANLTLAQQYALVELVEEFWESSKS